MAKVVIAELDIDIQELLKTTSDLKKEIDKVKNSQKELAASGQATSEAFVENEAVLKSLNSAYASNVKVIQESGKATAQQTDQTELLNLALTQEATSISEAREQNKLLNKLRNETNTTTKEGQAQLTALNAKLDQNNAYIKSNGDQYLKQKINIGNYKDSIKEAFSEMNLLNGGLQQFGVVGQAATIGFKFIGDQVNDVKNSFAGFTNNSKQTAEGLKNITNENNKAEKATIGFKIAQQASTIATNSASVALGIFKIALAATGVGLILLAFGALFIIFKQFTPIVDKVEQAMAGLSAVFSVVKNLVIGLVTGAKSLGSAFNGLSGDMDKAYKSAVALKKAQQDLEDSLKEQEVQSARNRAEINRLNIQAKDRTKTEKERLGLLTRSAELEKIDFAQRKRNSDEALRIAYEQIRIEGNLTAIEFAELKKRGLAYKEHLESKSTNNDENFDKLKDALLNETAVQNEFYANQEKNINKQNKLIEEQEAAAEKARQKRIEAAEKAKADAQKRIDDSIAQQESELKLLQEKSRFDTDEVKKAETLAIKEVEILKEKLKNKKISQTEFDAETLAIQNNIIELQRQQEEKVTEDLRVIQEKKKELEDQIAQQKADQLIAQREIDLANAKTQLEEDLLFNQQAYDSELAQLQKSLEDKKITEDQFREKKRLADAKQAEMDKLARINNTQSQLQEYAKITAGLEGLFGKNKALASATALINGGLAVTEILKTPSVLPEPIASISRAVQIAGVVGTTARSIAQINSAKFEQGGIAAVGGQRHAQGGTKFYGEDGSMFEAEKGEGIGVLNRKAFSAFMDFNNSFNGGKSTNGLFQGGGIITQGVRPETMDLNMIVGAIQSIPAPVVAVEEIQTVGNRYVNVKANADF